LVVPVERLLQIVIAVGWGKRMDEDAAELRQKAQRWRMFALGLTDLEVRRRIEALAADMERRAATLIGGDQDRARDEGC
jgi:hypothetical protein